MKYLNLDLFEKYNDFWVMKKSDITIGFSNASNNRSFNRYTEEGSVNLNSLKTLFNVESVNYLKQIHSNKVLVLNSHNKEFNENEGDGIVTNINNALIGIFTADCVPVILIDEKNKIISTIHSGWKGTYNSIVREALLKIQEEYGTSSKDIKAYIGPHIRQCCYEVSEELKEMFVKKFNVKDDVLFKGRNLSMEACIEEDLVKCGVSSENIFCLPLCTCCEKKEKLFSYRMSNGGNGRLFSIALIK